MSARLDLVGVRFGRLVAIKPVIDPPKGFRWLCQCDCGSVVNTSRGGLRSGKSKSCGCLNRVHGFTGRLAQSIGHGTSFLRDVIIPRIGTIQNMGLAALAFATSGERGETGNIHLYCSMSILARNLRLGIQSIDILTVMEITSRGTFDGLLSASRAKIGER